MRMLTTSKQCMCGHTCEKPTEGSFRFSVGFACWGGATVGILGVWLRYGDRFEIVHQLVANLSTSRWGITLGVASIELLIKEQIIRMRGNLHRTRCVLKPLPSSTSGMLTSNRLL